MWGQNLLTTPLFIMIRHVQLLVLCGQVIDGGLWGRMRVVDGGMCGGIIVCGIIRYIFVLVLVLAFPHVREPSYVYPFFETNLP
jgi:hypothetical protein